MQKKKKKTKIRTQEGVDELLAALCLSSSSDEGESVQTKKDSKENTTYPKCEVRYGDSSEKWVCCDGCGVWHNKKCTGLKRMVPKVFYCEKCATDS